MEYIELGSTGMRVSRLCLGGMSFGERSEDFHQRTLDYESSKNMIAYAYDAGINFIDTANGYSHGSSERFIGNPAWETGSERSLTDSVRKDKYDRAKENDMEIVSRVKDVADRLGVTMAEVALAWHYSKGVAAPIVGGSKVSHLEDALRAVELRLKPEDVRYLEEPYRPHEVVEVLPASE